MQKYFLIELKAIKTCHGYNEKIIQKYINILHNVD